MKGSLGIGNLLLVAAPCLQRCRLERPRDPSRIPLIPVAFGMGRSLKRPEFHGLETRLRVVPRVSESFELYVYLTEDGDGLEVSWSYNLDLFSAASIEHGASNTDRQPSAVRSGGVS